MDSPAESQPESQPENLELQLKGQEEKPLPRDGGIKGWLTVLGGFCVSFCTFGYINAFGIYQAYYITILPQSESTIAWIGSFQAFFMLSAGFISGPISDRYGPKVILFPCCTLYVTSIMLTSISTEYYQFLLAQGILGGIANGMTFTPAVAAIGQHFTHRRALALAIFAAGSSLGGIIYSIMLNRLLNHTSLGFGWSVRVIGFLTLFLSIISCTTITNASEPRKDTFFLPQAWKSKAYTLQVVAIFLTFWGVFIPFFFIPSYAESKGVSVGYSFDLIAILCGPSLVGRLVFGILSNRLGKFNTLIFCITACGILSLCWIRIESKASITVFTALYGITSGGIMSLFTATLAILAPKPNEIGTYVGMAMGLYGFAGLTGSPIGGAMISSYGTYTAASIFSGVVLLAGALALVFSRIAWAGTKLVA